MKEVISVDYQRVVKRHRRNGSSRWGVTLFEDKKIIICPRKNRIEEQLIDTIVHEEIHAVFPEFNEREARALTDALVESLTPDQKRKYLDLYGYDYIE
ncbi:hypothetical protein A3F29_02185 [Candidatus Roizmanbacteria bacterium RIFCSPHIGHO2_12_FULL_33_9]|uniref:SprT-like domain-containing protein n=1 Tax=Candidatus Roizmanbacteria bacterium RIFCSPHIGHO2_12_FULL_33_9 TaxID=1802045 RepID=A0A1F7HIL7_9BACT|nr:MAG: hypothetical protein A3F29_02185 [Candidatus Roizmanbacteria bacterium RIFCSPHIGHO2_12_FULL_33_9]